MLDSLQYLLDAGRSPATLKVVVAALSAHRDPVDQVSIGANRLVVAFLKVKSVHLKPPVRAVCSQWDLQVVLDRLCLSPYEPVKQAYIRSLSMKKVFVLAITSTKRVNQKSQRVACIVCEFAVAQVGTRGQSGYTLAESSISTQGIVTSVHVSTNSAGSIHGGGKGLMGSPMPSPYVEAVCIVDCLYGALETSFLSVLDPARKVHLCQNKGLLTGRRTTKCLKISIYNTHKHKYAFIFSFSCLSCCLFFQKLHATTCTYSLSLHSRTAFEVTKETQSSLGLLLLNISISKPPHPDIICQTAIKISRNQSRLDKLWTYSIYIKP